MVVAVVVLLLMFFLVFILACASGTKQEKMLMEQCQEELEKAARLAAEGRQQVASDLDLEVNLP